MGSVSRDPDALEAAPLIDGMENQAPAANRDHPDAPIPGSLEELLEGPLPRFLQEQNEGKRWIPYPVRRFAKAAWHWAQGPPNPKAFYIDPILPIVQYAPVLLLDRYVPKRKHRIALFIGYIFLWVLTFALVKRGESSATELKPWGRPQSIGCGSYFWGPGNSCDLNGNRCRPFSASEFAFRCPANCASYQLGEPRAVGDKEINYRSLVVGGPVNDTDPGAAYRGDSWICAAAIHDGVISDAEGGCGVVKLVGKRSSYSSSRRHGIESIGFDSYFPQSYVFQQSVQCKAVDLRWALLAVDVVYTAVLSLFTTSAPVFFFTIFSGVFWHVGLVSDPPPHSSFLLLFSTILGKYLPAMLAAWIIYEKMGVKRTLEGLTAQIEKTVLWLGACWVGALDNYTLSAAIPINRLNAHDINQQPGAKLALVLIVAALFLIVLKQIWFFRQEGRLVAYGRYYLALLGAVLLSLFLALWDLHLRIHHYVLALLLLPGTGMQTRPALLYQGLLVGLFVNGVARWGWAPVLETSGSLRGDGQLGSLLPRLAGEPLVRAGAGAALSNITFELARPRTDVRLDGISVLVNDVERFRGFFDEDEVFETRRFTWTRRGDQEIREYFRFGYMSGTRSLDYTRAGVWDEYLAWNAMEPGASGLRERSAEGEGEGRMLV